MIKNHLLDRSYFDEINSENSAYFLGFLFADGYNNTKSGVVRIRLQEDDKEILEWFSNELYGVVDLIFEPAKTKQFNTSSFYTSKPQYYLNISSRYISTKLEELGIVSKKSMRMTFPHYMHSSPLLHHFVRGYFDGDGSLSFYQYKHYSPWFQLNITSGSLIFLEQLSKLIEEKLSISFKVYNRPNRKCGAIQKNGNRQIKTFCDWMYDSSTIFLKRKYEVYKKLCQQADM